MYGRRLAEPEAAYECAPVEATGETRGGECPGRCPSCVAVGRRLRNESGMCLLCISAGVQKPEGGVVFVTPEETSIRKKFRGRESKDR